MVLWNNEFIILQLNVGTVPKWLHSGIKTVIEHTQKKYTLENDTQLRKNWPLLCDSKNSAMWQQKQRRCRTCGRKKFPQEKNARPPIPQERTKTQK